MELKFTNFTASLKFESTTTCEPSRIEPFLIVKNSENEQVMSKNVYDDLPTDFSGSISSLRQDMCTIIKIYDKEFGDDKIGTIMISLKGIKINGPKPYSSTQLLYDVTFNGKLTSRKSVKSIGSICTKFGISAIVVSIDSKNLAVKIEDIMFDRKCPIIEFPSDIAGGVSWQISFVNDDTFAILVGEIIRLYNISQDKNELLLTETYCLEFDGFRILDLIGDYLYYMGHYDNIECCNIITRKKSSTKSFDYLESCKPIKLGKSWNYLVTFDGNCELVTPNMENFNISKLSIDDEKQMIDAFTHTIDIKLPQFYLNKFDSAITNHLSSTIPIVLLTIIYQFLRE